MERIKKIKLSHLRHNEHAEFHKAVVAEIETATPAKLGIVKLFPAYKDALQKELTAIDVEMGSQYTPTIEDADIHRDELYRSLVLETKSKMVSYKPEYREAAARVKRIIDQVGGLHKQPYNQETESIQSLVNQLKGNYTADLEDTGLIEAVNQLEIANNNFNTHFGVRAGEVSARPSGDVKAERNEVDKLYKDIVDAVNGLALANDETAYRPTMDKMNYLVDYYENMLSGRTVPPKVILPPPPPSR